LLPNKFNLRVYRGNGLSIPSSLIASIKSFKPMTSVYPLSSAFK